MRGEKAKSFEFPKVRFMEGGKKARRLAAKSRVRAGDFMRAAYRRPDLTANDLQLR